MTPNLGGWIHNFTVTDTQTHKGGYTIYKITSIVFPRSLPQALTCLTIWKRFHEIKRLHRELSRRHRSLKLPGQLPEPTDSSFFKRFDVDVIRRRKEYILQLLDFAAQHPALYKCHAFTQFFSEAQQSGVSGLVASRGLNNLTVTPGTSPLHRHHTAEQLKGGEIEDICEKAGFLYGLHNDVGVVNITLPNTSWKESENENKAKTVVDTITYNENDTYIDSEPPNSENVQETTANANFGVVDQRQCKDYTRFLTPMASIESDDSDYIYEAALEFSKAVQAEANLDYKEAHMRYKRGVELLLIGSKDDTSEERKFIAKVKISKYLARADDIFDKFLCDNIIDGGCGLKKNFQLSIDVIDCGDDGKQSVYLEHPWNHLAKYKVLKVLGDSVMQVYCVTEAEPRTTYVMKGIEKPSSNMPTQTIFLPQYVPYMVDLLAFFQSDQKVFLLLKHAEGGRLYDYVQSYTPTVQVARAKHHFSSLFPDEIMDGQNNTIVPNVPQPNGMVSLKGEEEEQQDASISSPSKLSHNTGATKLPSSDSVEFKELVRSSQKLLQSVSKTLEHVKQIEDKGEPLKVRQKNTAFNNVEEETVLASPSRKKSITYCTFPKLPEASLKQWARELAIAINGLHAKGVILCDLHMDNMLLGAKGQLLLSYFYQNEGLSDADSYIHKAYSQKALDGHYVAPERPLTFKSDWWSYGVILYQLLLGLPFKSAHPGHIDLYGFVQYPENVEISPCARDLLEKLLQQSPEERADYEQIQTHAFFTGTDWEAVRSIGVSCNSNYRNKWK